MAIKAGRVPPHQGDSAAEYERTWLKRRTKNAVVLFHDAPGNG
jgi:hypothetical protein